MAEPTEDLTCPTDEAPAVERTERFGVAPDALWDAITDPELLAEWFGPVEVDLEPGGAITHADPAGEGATRTIGVVETVEPLRRIGFVWVAPGSESPSSVELVIEPDGDGSVLRIREAQVRPSWDARPAWFPATPRACACAGARA
ncbi:MAG TPA: SRPBCC domain-containing protein [Acidimicrobiia bacterium]